jgi:Xaa-Pro aminopeptidase
VSLIGKAEVHARQDAARRAAAAAGYDALLIVGRSFYDRPGDLAYLSNHFPPFPTAVFSSESRGLGHAMLLVPVEGEPVLLTDPRRHRADLVAVDDVRAAADLGAAIIALLTEQRLGSARIGLVGEDILPAAFDRQIRRALPSLQLIAENDIVARLRRRKSESEIALLRAAALAADAGIMAGVDALTRPGATERDVCAAGIAAAMLAAADFVRYFRVHSGPWSAAGSRWPQAMDREIMPGDIVVVDMVGALGGYGFDVNRTMVKGTPGARERELLETAATATAAAVAACIEGATVGDVNAAAAAVTGASSFGESAGAMIGHGIGLETVELPYLQPGGPDRLEPGMVLCVEPGIFVTGWAGVSIEQEVVVAASGPPDVLTPTPVRLW